MKPIITYLRVSTAKQGRSGLGLEAQRDIVQRWASQNGANIVLELVEVESGKRDDRPMLAKAFKEARILGATIVIATLDRLSRNVTFLFTLRDAGVPIIAADLPTNDTLSWGVRALLAQEERERISKRTKAALAARRARGLPLGTPGNIKHVLAANEATGRHNMAGVQAGKDNADAFAERLQEKVADLQAAGFTTLEGLAGELNRLGVRTARGKTWYASNVRLLLRRIESLVTAPAPARTGLMFTSPMMGKF